MVSSYLFQIDTERLNMYELNDNEIMIVRRAINIILREENKLKNETKK